MVRLPRITLAQHFAAVVVQPKKVRARPAVEAPIALVEVRRAQLVAIVLSRFKMGLEEVGRRGLPQVLTGTAGRGCQPGRRCRHSGRRRAGAGQGGAVGPRARAC